MAVAGMVGRVEAGLQPLAGSAERRYLGAASRRSQMTPTPTKQSPEFMPPLSRHRSRRSRLEREPSGLRALASAGPKGRARYPSPCEGCGGGNVGIGIGIGNRHLAVAINGRDAEILTPRPAAIVDTAGCKAAGYWPLAGGRAANRSGPTNEMKKATDWWPSKCSWSGRGDLNSGPPEPHSGFVPTYAPG